MSDFCIDTGFVCLDKLTGGIQKGALTVIASRPAMGKTLLILTICQNMDSSKKILYFSLSERNKTILNKIVRQNSDPWYLPCTPAFDPSRLVFPGESLNFDELKVILDSISEDDYDLVVVDGFQELMGYPKEVSYEFMKANNAMLCYFKRIAREKNVAFVLTTNVSRKVDERSGHRPCMTDFNDCEMENYANLLIFLLRREYYDPYDKPGQAEVIVAKNRHGGVGSVFLTFRKELAQFANYSASLDSQPPNDEAFSAFTAR